MKHLLIICASLVLTLGSAMTAAEPEVAKTESAPAAETAAVDTRLPGVALAEGISQLTGTAISPLWGVSAVGAWQYLHATEAERVRLPWYTHPAVWGTGLCILALCMFKDVLGAAAPALLKKPLDVVELFEDKASALVACSAFAPFVAAQIARISEASAASGGTALVLPVGGPFASIAFLNGMELTLVLAPLAMLWVAVIWLVSHSINVLIALSPFGLVDAGLKLFKGGLLALVTLSSFLSPILGLIVCLVIFMVALLLVPTAFRLTVFGTLFGLDILFPARGRKSAKASEPHAFLARKVSDAPVRTYGRLSRRDDGGLVFSYRPWLILPKRVIALPEGAVVMAKGILFPSLIHRSEAAAKHRMMIMFLPRYRNEEQSIAECFDIGEIRPSPILKGIGAIRAWFAEVINLGKAGYSAVSSRLA